MKKQDKRLIVKILILIVLFAVFLFSIKSFIPENTNIYNATIDLKTWNFAKKGTLFLDGSWEFYPEKRAQEIPIEKNNGYLLDVPQIWNHFAYENKKMTGVGYGSYRLFLKLPPEERFFLKIANVSTAYNLYVDRKLVASNGTFSKKNSEHKPEFKSKIVSFDTKGEETEVIMEISNFSHYKGGFWKSIIIGDSDSIKTIDDRKKIADIMIVGFLLTTSFIYFTIGYYIRKEKKLIYLAIFLLTLSARLLFTGERIINSLINEIPWTVLVKGEYLSYYLAIPAFLFFMCHYFTKCKFNFFVKISIFFYFFNSLIVIIAHPLFFTSILTIVNMYTLVIGLYLISKFYKIAKSGQKGVMQIFIGIIILLISVFIEIYTIQTGEKIISSSIIGVLIFVIILIFQVNKSFSLQIASERENTVFLQDISNKDSLTGLFNHGFILEKLSEYNNYETLSVGMFDLDDFKKVNDNFGHKSGDAVLQETSNIIKENIRDNDFPGRYGGEEFIIIFSNTNIDNAFLISERIREKIEEEVEKRTGIKITISGGVAEMTPDTEDIIKEADVLLYQAKAEGKNKIIKQNK